MLCLPPAEPLPREGLCTVCFPPGMPPPEHVSGFVPNCTEVSAQVALSPAALSSAPLRSSPAASDDAWICFEPPSLKSHTHTHTHTNACIMGFALRCAHNKGPEVNCSVTHLYISIKTLFPDIMKSTGLEIVSP